MRTRYFTPTELVSYCFNRNLNQDLDSLDYLARCSIADLIELCEAYNKGNLSIDYQTLQETLAIFSDSPIEDGRIFVSYLDQETLSSALFKDERAEEFWEDAITSQTSPMHSIRKLTLRKTDEWDIWGENVYQEMEDFFSD